MEDVCYYILSRKNVEQFAIKEHLGHKAIGVEPDIIIDLNLLRPRIIIRGGLDIRDKKGIEELESGYFTRNNNKTYLNFTYLKPKNIIFSEIESEINQQSIKESKLLNSLLEDGVLMVGFIDHPDVILVHSKIITELCAKKYKDVEVRK
ncbi:hypothetical protein G3U99_20555 [Vibrio coralliilyticus OCN008]|uniref:hypothetical protein n=1 Tax=Vibrio coralliilyticus TaxID=190893 RepID=UPI0003916973|nr:hypothetical protein [Vibrio coralliilyticus]ERB66786.1 hypothetical protein N779_02600 [Vibrio coralliilyticus OCN008]QIJ86650.1 hypothetical protein G3U99_20555 [Vibrio coralliilyticus OCN008]